jgi:hypothetical protein
MASAPTASAPVAKAPMAAARRTVLDIPASRYGRSLAVNLFLSICFNRARPLVRVRALGWGIQGMPKNVAQWTGLAVTAIVVLGCDIDVVYAMPLGIFAGALATFFVGLAEHKNKTTPEPVRVRR